MFLSPNSLPELLSAAFAVRRELLRGGLYYCNNVAQVDRMVWLDQLERGARKAGRPILQAEWIEPEEDFPSRDANPPLKMLCLSV